eukprot:scaffold130188_cov63-Phaeocystis_antarctica.AAC.2
MTQNTVEAIASNVWAVMMAQPALFALTMAACIAFEQSEESSDVHVTFKENSFGRECLLSSPRPTARPRPHAAGATTTLTTTTTCHRSHTPTPATGLVRGSPATTTRRAHEQCARC